MQRRQVPRRGGHPCAKAAKALDEAGHSYEMKQVKGGALKLWSVAVP
jgi:hypothetical protein